jgi:hypothetical protein
MRLELVLTEWSLIIRQDWEWCKKLDRASRVSGDGQGLGGSMWTDIQSTCNVLALDVAQSCRENKDS